MSIKRQINKMFIINPNDNFNEAFYDSYTKIDEYDDFDPVKEKEKIINNIVMFTKLIVHILTQSTDIYKILSILIKSLLVLLSSSSNELNTESFSISCFVTIICNKTIEFPLNNNLLNNNILKNKELQQIISRMNHHQNLLSFIDLIKNNFDDYKNNKHVGDLLIFLLHNKVINSGFVIDYLNQIILDKHNENHIKFVCNNLLVLKKINQIEFNKITHAIYHNLDNSIKKTNIQIRVFIDKVFDQLQETTIRVEINHNITIFKSDPSKPIEGSGEGETEKHTKDDVIKPRKHTLSKDISDTKWSQASDSDKINWFTKHHVPS